MKLLSSNRIFIIMFVMVVVLIAILFGTSEKYKKRTRPNICNTFPYLPQCIIPESREIVQPRLSMKPKEKRAFCVSGGGTLSQSTAHGVLAAILKYRRSREGTRMSVSDLFKDFNNFSGSSGGNVFLSMLAYDRGYNESFNSIGGNLTAQKVAEKFHDTYITEFNQIRDQADEFNPSALDSLQLPYFFKLVFKLLTIDSPGVLGLGGIGRLGSAYMLDRHKKTLMKDTLPEYGHLNVTIAGSVLTTGDLSLPGSSEEVSYSYNLPAGEECMTNLPFGHGPLTSVSTVNGVEIKEYKARSLDSFRYWDGWRFPPGPVPDNTMFDTCKWVDKYEDGWFSDTLLPYKVYRCKNVASSECCQNNSQSNKCTGASLVTFTSKPNTLSFARNIYSDTTQYFAYNIETEKEPTGEWEGNFSTESIPNKAVKFVAEVPTNINRMNYDTSRELLGNVIGVTTALPGIIRDPCIIKSAFYRGGFSDQEQFVARFSKVDLDMSVFLKTNNSADSNKRLYSSACSIINDCGSTNEDMKVKLSKLANSQPLALFDAAGCDNTGVLTSVLEHQQQSELQTLNICAISRVPEEIAILFKRNPRYVNADGSSKLFDDVTTIVDVIMDVVNDVANFNTFQEAGLIVGTIAAESLVFALGNLISPLLGIALTASLIASLTEIVWEALDLDTDYHVTTDNFGKTFKTQVHLRAPSIFDKPDIPLEEFSTTVMNNDGDSIPFSLKRYENLTTINNPLFGIRAGTKVNLTAITCESTGQLISFFGDGKNFKDTVKYSFEGIERALSDSTGRRIIEKTFM